MTLDELHACVSEAILRAEALQGSDARRAFREVAELEEAIASVCGVGTAEGEAAHLGAITARLRAGEPLPALHLADRYDGLAFSEPAGAELKRLVLEADRMLDEMVSFVPAVIKDVRPAA